MSVEDPGIASSSPDDGAAVVAGSNPGHGVAAIAESELQSQERAEDELIMHLERDQFVAETSRPVPRAPLSASASAGLWALRVFVVLVSLMVIYTFVAQLH
jgi:hypothetical protein